MHELSIVMGIIDIAEQQMKQANATVIEEIELNIGILSGVEINALNFAWSSAVKHTVLENTIKKINIIDAKATCIDCNIVFSIEHYYDPCPICGQHLIAITKGKELSVKSLVVS
jgi:hydrogenase nickel incorporation protein HypA/HybF